MEDNINFEDFSDDEKNMLRLFELYESGICWECGRQMAIDFRNPDKDNWVEVVCPNCSYRTYIQREI